MTDDLLAELLAKPVGKAIEVRSPVADDFTHEIQVSGNTAVVEIRDEDGTVNEGTAAKYLSEEGLSVDDWEVTHFRKIKYGAGLESVRFSYKRVASGGPDRTVAIDEMIDAVEDYTPTEIRPVGDHGFLVLIGDMQFGKIDGDGPSGTVRRTIEAINKAADRLIAYRRLFDIGHIHIAWLGDHIEGFVSQGGANVWRTPLTLNEQIRLTRRVMLHALKTFAGLADKVSMAAVPGNHGEPVRFAGTGVTRYDDSHDTESLIAVKDVVDTFPEAFGHVEFYVPDTDELIVMVNVAGTIVAHHHGHKWRPGKQFEWWSKQAFNRESPMHVADLLVAGHLHHEHFETSGSRDYWGINALESESTWFRHTQGVGGSPGIQVGITKGGDTTVREAIKL